MPNEGLDRKLGGLVDKYDALTARAAPARQAEQNQDLESIQRSDLLLNYTLKEILDLANRGNAPAVKALKDLVNTADLGFNPPEDTGNRYSDVTRPSLISDAMYRFRTDEPEKFKRLQELRLKRIRERMIENAGKPPAGSNILDRIQQSVNKEFGH